MARNSDPLTITVPPGYLLHGQFRHLLLLAALLPGVLGLASDDLGDGAWLGLSDRVWLGLAVGVPIVQQVLVALLWRGQLCASWLTRAFGDRGFVVWGMLFFPLLVARPLAIAGVAVADAGSLPIPSWLGIAVGTAMLVPAVWTMHSVRVHFGFARALGGDHFFERYRTMPFVRAGAFRYSSNAMYLFVFVGLWGIALIGRSQVALAAALFQHAYIWVHWYCTEQPDAVVLYGRSPEDAS